MPMKEYECPSCLYIFARYGGFEEDEEEVNCPRCGASGAAKVPFSPSSSLFGERRIKEKEARRGCRILFG